MGIFIAFLGTLGFISFLTLLIVNAIIKQQKRIALIGLGASIILLMIAYAIMMTNNISTQTKQQEKKQVVVATQKPTQHPLPAQDSIQTPTPIPTITPTPSPTNKNPSNYLMNLEVKTEAVKSGSGNNIGEYAYILASKGKTKEVSTNDYVTFVGTVVKKRQILNNKWFVIKFEDGTGIIFTGCLTELAVYGELAVDGSLLKSKEYIFTDKNPVLSKILK